MIHFNDTSIQKYIFQNSITLDKTKQQLRAGIPLLVIHHCSSDDVCDLS